VALAASTLRIVLSSIHKLGLLVRQEVNYLRTYSPLQYQLLVTCRLNRLIPLTGAALKLSNSKMENGNSSKPLRRNKRSMNDELSKIIDELEDNFKSQKC